MMRTITALALLCLTIASLAGCGGGDTYVKVQGTTTISKGQELTDLQRALREGALDQSEYERLHRKILNRPN
jgi:hypothetical protein